MQCPKCKFAMPETGQCPRCDDIAQARSDEQATSLPNNQAFEARSGEDSPAAVSPETPPPPDTGSAASADDHPQKPPRKNEPEPQADPPRRSDQKTAASQGKVKNRIERNKMGQFIVAEGKVGFVANNAHFHLQGDKEQQETYTPVSDLLIELPYFPSKIPVSALDNLSYYSSRLQDERWLLLSCLDENLALKAAHTLIQQLSGKKRQLDFSQAPEGGRGLNIHYLLDESEEELGETNILADMFSPSTESFLNSLVMASVSYYGVIRDRLKTKNLRLICIADPIEIEKWNEKARNLSSVQWHLPFLRPMLQTYYLDQWGDLETQLKQQREDGKWKRNEREFYKEVIELILSQSLPAELAKRDATTEPASAEPASANIQIRDKDPVEKTVLYVATYFPNLSVNEFDRIVSLFLGERAMTVKVKTNEPAQDGTTNVVWKEEEKRLIDLWRNGPPDEKIKGCGLVSRKGPPKIITFADDGSKEAVGQQLEEEHAFFLGDRFRDIQKLGLLFDPSETVAENVINLHLEMLASDPEAYDVGWMAEAAHSIDGGGFWSQRVTRLIREMLKRPELAQLVEDYFNQLMARRQHRLVLELVKRLRLAKGFKDLQWIKRLLNESDESTRQRTYAYLYAEACRMGFSICELLETVESWLPRDDSDVYPSSNSESYALQLLIEYCLETTSLFKQRHYGLWPSRYTLFAAQDEKTIRQHLRLLTRWLFHPSLKYVFDSPISKDDSDRLLGELLAEWFFIIKGLPQEGPGKVEVEEIGRATDGLLEMLLEEIIAQTMTPTRKGAQRALIDCWQHYMEFLLLCNKSIGSADRKLSRELSWRRNLIYRVLKQFRELQRKYQAASRPSHAETAGRG